MLVPTSSDLSSDDSTGTERGKIHHRRTKSSVPRSETYEANTGRKYEINVPSSKAKGSDKKHEGVPLRDRRRTKLDGLPAIVTDSSSPTDRRSPRDIRKARSAAAVEQPGEDYFSPKESSRSHVESMLSPDVIKHSTKGKDRPYWDGGSSPNAHRGSSTRPAYPSDNRNSAYEPRESRYKDSRHNKSSSPTLERRSTLDLPSQTKKSPKDSYNTRTRRETEALSPRLERKDSSRSYGRPHRESHLFGTTGGIIWRPPSRAGGPRVGADPNCPHPTRPCAGPRAHSTTGMARRIPAAPLFPRSRRHPATRTGHNGHFLVPRPLGPQSAARPRSSSRR